jgi:hypothetical protein
VLDNGEIEKEEKNEKNKIQRNGSNEEERKGVWTQKIMKKRAHCRFVFSGSAFRPIRLEENEK